MKELSQQQIEVVSGGEPDNTSVYTPVYQDRQALQDFMDRVARYFRAV